MGTVVGVRSDDVLVLFDAGKYYFDAPALLTVRRISLSEDAGQSAKESDSVGRPRLGRARGCVRACAARLWTLLPPPMIWVPRFDAPSPPDGMGYGI